MKKSRRQSLEKKLAVAASVVQLLNAAAPIALPYVNVARDVRTAGGNATPLSDNLARTFYGTAQAGATQTVNNGETSTWEDQYGRPLGSGDMQIVNSGGIGTVTSMTSGEQIINNDGIGTVTTMSGGTQDIWNGGVGTIGTMNGGTQNVYYGGVGTITAMNGGTQIVSDGGIALGTKINSGGTQIVSSGGTAKGTVDNGGVLELHGAAVLKTSDGSALDYEKYALHGGTLRITDGASMAQICSVANGTLELAAGGRATSTTIARGGTQVVKNGGAGYVTDGGGVLEIHNGAQLNGGTNYADYKLSGGTLRLVSRANMSRSYTVANGTLEIGLSGRAANTTIASGGTQVVLSGGAADGVRDGGGVLELHSGAVLSNSTDYNTYALSGGTLRLTDKASVDNYTVSNGTLELASGGTATNVTVNGGTQNIASGGVASGGTLKGGAQNIASGGTATNTFIEGGTQNVASGGVTSGGTLKSGAQNVASGGTATGMTVSGGVQNIEEGAAVSDTTVKGGTQTVRNGAVASGGDLSDGALQIVEAGGSAKGLTLNDKGAQNVYGTAEGTTISRGGAQHVFSGGSATGTMLSGGTITVEDYGTAQIDKAEGGTVELLDTGLATAIFGNVSDAAAGSYSLDTLYARGDTVILGQGDAKTSPVGNKLNVKTMDGYANFVVNTDLANNQSDEIHIENATNGTKANTIRINHDPTLAKKQTVASTHTKVATVASGKAAFEGAKSTIGGIDYMPVVETEDGGASWYITGLGNKGASDGSHHTLMGMTAATAALAAGNAFIDDATAGLGLAANAGKDGVSAFAKLGGGSVRQETGSHVDLRTWNAILALGHANKKERGTFEYGAFFEYGSGNYTTHDAGLRGDGSLRYTGGGLLAKWTANHGFYVEGGFRAGSVHDDANNVLHDDVNTYSYTTNAGYFGAHLGVGKEIEVAGGNTVDVYGKYFYNRRNGVSFDTGVNAFDLDAVTSSVLRVGARYTMKREKWNFYGGLAYEYEMNGKATGTVDGLAIRGADIGGGSFRAELGATMKPDANSPWSLDLNLTGFAGKKDGVSGGISVAWMF